MQEITRIDYTKITDDMMDQIIMSLFLLKQMNPEKDIYFNEKSILRIVNMGGSSITNKID